MKVFKKDNVLEASRKRISMLFDNFETIVVSISSGKDSTTLYHLVLQEAIKRNRKMVAFFQDQEAEYQASIDLIEKQMVHKNVIPRWYQVPIYLTNSTSYSDYFLYAWGENEEWVREKSDIAIKEINEEYPKRFYKFFEWVEQKDKNAAYLVGLRADEGITRYRATTKKAGWKDIKWSTTTNGVNKFYPIYDWGVKDVWKFIYDNDIEYNKIYDLMFLDNYSIWTKMRVSNLIHEKSFKCLVDLPRFEPDTFDKLCQRIGGIDTASRYASEKLMFSNKVLPKHYKKWEDFRDFLLKGIKDISQKEKFEKRFSKQAKTEKTYQAQVGQLLINDWENSKPIDNKKAERIRQLKEKWMKIL